jgi:class 3 adenylate cyclase
MSDINKMNRTWLCSVLFLDIVNYSSQSVELQIKWKDRFNGYLANSIRDVPDDERVILDTGDGAATCFLGAPEAAMFAALELWHSLLLDERDQQPPFKVRIGINLGPVKLVRDINGAPNAIGDGMNAGQRVMSFAGENQILVSQSYFEVVSRLSDDYKNLFTLKGVETDKHIREHTVYHLAPPGAQHGPIAVKIPIAETASPQPSPTPEKVAPVSQENRLEKKTSRSLPLLVGGIAVLVVSVAAAWHFAGPTAQATQSPAVVPSTTVPSAVAPSTSAPSAAAPAAPSTPISPPAVAPEPVSQPPVAAAPRTAPSKPAVVSTPVVSPASGTAAATTPASQAISAADQATARDLRERYANDASRAAIAQRNAEEIRRNLSAKGMSLNAQTAAAVDRLGLLLDEAAEAMRDHRWDDALSNLQAVEATTEKINKTVGN